MMDQSKQFEDGFNTENESTEEISIEDDDRTTKKSCQWKSVVVTKKHQEVFENQLPEGFNYIVYRKIYNNKTCKHAKYSTSIKKVLTCGKASSTKDITAASPY